MTGGRLSAGKVGCRGIWIRSCCLPAGKRSRREPRKSCAKLADVPAIFSIWGTGSCRRLGGAGLGREEEMHALYRGAGAADDCALHPARDRELHGSAEFTNQRWALSAGARSELAIVQRRFCGGLA